MRFKKFHPTRSPSSSICSTSRKNKDEGIFDIKILLRWNEERYNRVCGKILGISKSEGGTSTSRWLFISP